MGEEDLVKGVGSMAGDSSPAGGNSPAGAPADDVAQPSQAVQNLYATYWQLKDKLAKCTTYDELNNFDLTWPKN